MEGRSGKARQGPTVRDHRAKSPGEGWDLRSPSEISRAEGRGPRSPQFGVPPDPSITWLPDGPHELPISTFAGGLDVAKCCDLYVMNVKKLIIIINCIYSYPRSNIWIFRVWAYIRRSHFGVFFLFIQDLCEFVIHCNKRHIFLCLFFLLTITGRNKAIIVELKALFVSNGSFITFNVGSHYNIFLNYEKWCQLSPSIP